MRSRNTLIMAVVAVLLATAVYFLEIRGADEREAAEAVAERLVRFESDDVVGMTVTSGDRSVTLARGDGTWRITAPYDLAADQSAVDGILNRLQSADHERVVEEAPEDLARFGLAQPQLSVELELSDGSRRQVVFGDGTPVGFNVFVKTGDGDTVYTAAAGIKDAADKSLYDLRDRSVLSFADADITRIEIEEENDETTVERQPAMGDGIERWQMTAPLAARADSDRVAALLRRLRTANAVSFAADDPSDEEIATFGLDAPRVTVRLWTEDDSAQTLLIGGSAEEPAGRYARRLGEDAVMIIPNAVVNELPESADALRNRTVVEFARDRVQSITLRRGDETLRLEKDGIDWRLTAPRALAADAGAISSLLTAALDLQTHEFPAGGPDTARFGLGAPALSVTFELEALPGDDTEAGRPAETYTLEIGAATEVEPEDAGGEEDPEPVAARYVAVAGNPVVYLVEQADLEDVDVDLFTLRSKTLVSFAQSDLTELEVSTPDRTVTLVKDAEGTWTIDGAAVSDETATQIDDALWRLNYLDMQSIVSEEAGIDRAPWGLDTPSVRVRASIDGNVVADVSVGADVPAAELQDLPPLVPPLQTYASVQGVDGVYRIDANLRDALQVLLIGLS